MDMAPAITDSTSADAAAPTHIPARAIERELLVRSIGRPFLNRLPTLVPLLVIGLAAAQMPARNLAFFLIACQLTMVVLTAFSAARVFEAMENHRPARQKIRAWLMCEAISGFVWGLMVALTVDIMATSGSAALISIVLLVTITAGCLVAATAPGLSQAMLGGFAAAAVPVTFWNLEAFGPVVVIALLLVIPSLLWMAEALRKQARRALRTELENHMLSQQLGEALEAARHMSLHDSLTGLLNRRAFEQAARELRDRRRGKAIGIVAIDLDHFKQVNDTYGHGFGDAVLKEAARILRENLRVIDISASLDGTACEAIARWGGEEFIVALASDSADDAANVAERLRAALADFRGPDWPEGLSLTASFGLVLWQDDDDLGDAIASADSALYRAKDAGRNCLRFAEDRQLPDCRAAA